MHEKSILMVVTGAADPAQPDRAGLNRASFSGPRALLSEAGWPLTLASPHGDAVAGAGDPADPLTEARPLEAVWEQDFDAVFVAGGPGALVDLPDNPLLISLIERSSRRGVPVAAVAEGVAALVGCKTPDDGALVQNRRLTCPAPGEITQEAPFELALRLRQLGAILEHADAGLHHVVEDELLITGQNAGSALDAARCLIERLK